MSKMIQILVLKIKICDTNVKHALRVIKFFSVVEVKKSETRLRSINEHPKITFDPLGGPAKAFSAQCNGG